MPRNEGGLLVASADLKVIITGDASGLERAYARAGAATGRFGSKLGTLTKAGLIGAAVGGTALLAKGLQSSLSAAMEAEKAQASLAAQLKASGIALDASRGTIDKTVQSLSAMSGIDDEALTSAFTRLVRSTGSVKQAQEQMMLVADMARAKQMDVGAAADVVGKAVDGNVGILKRYGVEIEKGASVTQALGAAQQAFAGQAKAYGDTSAGAQDKVRVAIENVQESIGAKLLPAFNQMLAWAAQQLPKIQAFFDTHGGSIRRVLNGIGEFIRAVWVPIFNTGREIAQAMIAGVRRFMDQHGTEVERIFGRIKTAVMAVATVMQFLAEKVVLPIMKPLFQSVLPTVLGVAVSAIDKVTGAIAKVKDGILWLGNKASALFGKFKEAIKAPAAAAAAALGPLNAVVNSIIRAIDGIIGRAAQVASALSRVQSAAGGIIGKIPGLADGGPVSAGQAYIVGERGPELFVPGRSGTIVPDIGAPTRGTASATTSGTGTVVVNLPNYLGSPTEVAQVIRRELIRLGRDNGGNILAGVA